jgi:hypothetical protein
MRTVNHPESPFSDHSLRAASTFLVLLVVACDAGAAGGEEAASAERTSRPSASRLDPCIQGTWEMEDLQAFYDAFFAEEEEDPDLQLSSSEVHGTVVYAFLPGARAEVRYDGAWTFAVEGESSTWGSRMVGTARATWEVDGDFLRLGPLDMTDVRVAMQMDGRDLSEPAPLNELIGSADWMEESVSRIRCRGSEMTFEMIEPTPAPEVRLRRIG